MKDRTRRTALVAGVLYLVTFAASIPAVFLLAPVLNDAQYVMGAGPDSQVLAGAFLDLVNAFACIGTAVALFSIVRLEHEGMALGFVTTRVMEAAIIVIGVIALLAVVTLRQQAPADQSAALVVAQGMVAVRNWTFLLGPSLMPAFNAALLATLMYRAQLVPRIIPILGMIGAPLLFLSTTGQFFGVNSSTSVISGLATLPIFLWELSLGLYLTSRGFRPDAPIVIELNSVKPPAVDG